MTRAKLFLRLFPFLNPLKTTVYSEMLTGNLVEAHIICKVKLPSRYLLITKGKSYL